MREVNGVVEAVGQGAVLLMRNEAHADAIWWNAFGPARSCNPPEFLDAGHQPVILDDFSTGHDALIAPNVPVYRGNVGDSDVTDKLFAEHSFDAVMHFAASIIVPESVSNPLKYYLNNTVNLL